MITFHGIETKELSRLLIKKYPNGSGLTATEVKTLIDNCDPCISIFGFSLPQVLEVVADYHDEMKKPKMTREEAARIIHSKVYGITNTGQAAKWVDALEALGLIKFDEAELLKPTIKLIITNNLGESAPVIIAQLDLYGYKIVKKD